MIAELPLHPKLVHLPVALAVLMPLLSGGVLFAWWRGWFHRGTWTIVLGVQTLLVASGLLAMRSGEADEDRVEAIVGHAALHEHEEAAEVFQWGSAVVLLLAMGPLLLRHRNAGLWAGAAVTAGSVVVLALAVRTGTAGGELVYRHGAAAAWATPTGTTTPVPAAMSRDDDDDR
ncbi:MAG: DUF2231 domain-containing protein [Planctomycetota bacterium]